MQQNLRIALLDSDSDVRGGRRMIISSRSNFDIVLDSKGQDSDIDAVADGLVDILVLDQSVVMGPGVSFYSLLRKQMGIKKAPACVITTSFDQSALSLSALEVGVNQVVSIEQGPELLLEAIENAGAGIQPISMDQLHELVISEGIEHRLDLELSNLVSALPEKLASNLRRLRSVWVRAIPKQLKEFSLSNLDALVARLPVSSAAELVIRLERTELLSEK
jgi:DNA-binding NarL/FixJ family response regulator